MSTPLPPNASDREEPVPAKDQVLQGHTYDGIKEYDNPMPGWWVYTFWATIAFAAFYVLGLHVFDFINSYEDDLAVSQTQLQNVRAEYAKANPTFDATEESLEKFIEDDAKVSAGAATFATSCAACHGDKGQGLIGPNLTDEYWIHGGKSTDVFKVVSDGVAAKGMPAWAATLKPEQRAELVAYIESLAGSNPPGAREPQGEVYKED